MTITKQTQREALRELLATLEAEQEESTPGPKIDLSKMIGRQWRTIEEAPPEEGIYLAWQTIPPIKTPDGIDRSGPTILAWVDGDSYNGWGVAYVTYWTPLPEPPND